jgi:hypothetical protein
MRKQGEEHTVDELTSALEETQENLQRTFSC